MRAVRVHAFGAPEVLQYDEVPVPTPASDGLLVRVRAAGVNVLDWLVRRGGFDEFAHIRPPWIPGWDVSGVVEETGADVAAFRPGDEVYGLVGIPRPGSAYAEYVAVPATSVVRKPEQLTHVEAAALPMAGLTAWRALVLEGGVGGGQRVLIHAAAGGVGHLAVQIAKARGAHVIGTASAPNREFLQALGVDEFVDYRAQAFEERVAPVDVVIDTVGGGVQERSLTILKPGGVLVALPEPVTPDVVDRADQQGVRTRYFSVEPDADGLEGIGRLVGDDSVRPTISAVFPLAEARRAHELGETGHVRGKLVLEV